MAGGGGIPAGVTQGQWYFDTGHSISLYFNSNQTSILSFTQSIKPWWKATATFVTTNLYVKGGIAFDAVAVGNTYQYAYFYLYVASQELSGTVNVYNVNFGFIPTLLTAGKAPSNDLGGAYATNFTMAGGVNPTLLLKRVGPWVAFYINAAPVQFPTYYADLGIPTMTPPVGMGSEWFFYEPPPTSSIQVSSNVGLYAALNATAPDGSGNYQNIQFNGIFVEELVYQKSLENMIEDASGLGGVMVQNVEQTFSDTFSNLNNWQ